VTAAGTRSTRLALVQHPDTQCAAVTRLDALLACDGSGQIMISYRVAGEIGRLRIPPVSAAGRTDGLWQHTCFELFIRPADEVGYREFNFSPSTQWAAYRFDRYRSGMRDAEMFAAPGISVRSTDQMFALDVTLELDEIVRTGGGSASQLGIAAVIEDIPGNRCYWALAHPPGRPDFHAQDGFAFPVPGNWLYGGGK